MESTFWLALYGAIVSSLVAGWTIYKDAYRFRPRVRAYIGTFELPVGDLQPDYLVLRVQNRSDDVIKIANVAYRSERAFKSVRELLSRDHRYGFIAQNRHLNGAFPITIAARDSFEIVIPFPLAQLPNNIGCLLVRTTDGLDYYVPNSDLLSIRKAIKEAGELSS